MPKFGTEGWRGIIGEDFTARNVCRVSRAVASYLAKSGNGKVVVGYDRRFLSERFAELSALELTRGGLEVILSSSSVPTPCLSFAVKQYQADGGVMVTASHNPPIYNGMKFKEAFGGPALPETTGIIEAEMKNLRRRRQKGNGPVKRADLSGPYLERVWSLIDHGQLERRPLRIVVNPLHGSAAGILPKLFKGSRVQVREINGEYNPGFGGRSPDPTRENLVEMGARVRRLRADLGIAFDGDGDRLALIDEAGNYISPQKVFALIIHHLLANGKVDGAVAKTVSTTRMIDLLCQRGGVKLYETPVGFKHIAMKMLNNGVAIGGEESGGIGIKEHLPDRDGIMAALLIIEMVAANGKPVSALVSRLHRELGNFYYARQDLSLSPYDLRGIRNSLNEKIQLPLPGSKLLKVTRVDGLKYIFRDGSWLLLRPSGTEPVLRIYAEAPSRDKLQSLLAIGTSKCLRGSQG